MNKLFLSPNNRHSLQLRDIANKLTKTGTTDNEKERYATALERSRSQIQSTFIKAIAYRSASKKSFQNWLKITKLRIEGQMIFSDETIIRLNTLKGLVMEFDRKKEDRTKSSSIQSR